MYLDVILKIFKIIEFKLLLIIVNIKFGKEGLAKTYNFTKTSKSDYSVSTQYSQTRNNEKKMTELLSEKLAEEILTEIRKKINDI